MYGREYLREVVEVTAPFVDKVIVLYTKHGSQGYRSAVPCPESEEELRACFDAVSDKMVWHRGEYHTEGRHRQAGYDLAAGADLILQHDCDEVWCPAHLQACIQKTYDGHARHTSINGFLHHWRSLAWVCRDVWTPMRIIKPRGVGNATIDGTVHHMSYAQRPEIVRYKLMEVSGHRDELRPRWLEDIFMGWPDRRTDLHPCVTGGWWNAESFPAEALPECLRRHPNFGKEAIV